MRSFVIALLLLSIVTSAHGLNILVWTSTIGLSHTNFLGGIADTLKEDGHNVTLLLVEFDPDFTGETGTKLVEHIIRYSSPYHDPADWYTLTFKKDQVFNVVLGLNVRDLARMQVFAYNICRGILEDSLLLRQLRESRFDLGIFEMMHSCPAGVMELVGIPKTMLVSAIGMGYHHYRLLGMEKPASFVPGWMCANICEYFEQSLFDSMLPGFPRLHNLIQDKTDYFLMNTNEFTESTRPTLLSIGHVGGSSIATPRPLSDEFERIVSKGREGVILFSLGSLVKSSDMPVAARRGI
ncbi:hypothetical protein TELCIR_05871 [Teladorsagia circumcincta]|uniref:glucuronosyltransferase n=1 Tax=Teladorsagia circumcincta TaxID=45464 RepID=A0A2G9UPJ2_TELCI|nr:hypothetical protein TELCIR_05871 [Teladorsagia circumcincta]